MFEKKDTVRGKFLSGWFSVGSLGSATGGYAPSGSPAPAPAANGMTTEGGTIIGTEGGTNIGTESM